MNGKLFLVGLAAGLASIAQTSAPANSAVSGFVKDRTNGQPLANYNVSTWTGTTYIGNTMIQSKASKEVKATTDSSGRYKLSDLPPGEHRISAMSAEHPGTQLARQVTTAGVDLENIDFLVRLDGTIKGKVLDENKEPIPGLNISLVSREYFMGSVGYFVRGRGRTNDLGEYTLERVDPGHPYLVLAEKRDQKLPALSEVPLDPKLRKRVPVRTFYPNSPVRESAEAVVLRPGEHREGLDIEMKKAPAYCIDGTVVGTSGPEGLTFSVESTSPGNGISAGGGFFSVAPTGTVGTDGKFRVCELTQGTYRLVGSQRLPNTSGQAPNLATLTLTISDEDQHNLKLAPAGGVPLDGDVVLDGPVPATPLTAKAIVSIRPMFRAPYIGEVGSPRADIPGTFSISSMSLEDYQASALVLDPSLYVKDITYGDRSVMYESLHLGSAMAGSGHVRVTLGQDGGTVGVQVADKVGNPGADLHVLVLPADVRTEAEVQARMIQGQTNQAGQYTSPTVAPGKYYVAATDDAFDATVESIAKLWRTRNRFKEVDVAPRATPQVKVEPVKLD